MSCTRYPGCQVLCAQKMPMMLNACATSLSQDDSRNDDNKHNRKDDQQTASLPPRILLISAGAPQLYIRMLRIRSHILHVPTYRIELSSLFVHDMRHISKQLIELSNALLDIPYLRFPLHNQGLLEVNFILRRQSQLILFLQLRLLLLRGIVRIWAMGGVFGFESGPSGGCGHSLLLKCLALDSLKFGA